MKRLAAPLLVWPLAAAAIDLAPLWDFARPELSEQRFRSALASALERASGDDALILQTQIARTFGLRRDFARAQALLREVEPQLPTAGPEARVRWSLEMGRTHASATHPPHTQTDAERDALGRPDRHVFEELEALHRERGDAARADHYARRRKALEP